MSEQEAERERLLVKGRELATAQVTHDEQWRLVAKWDKLEDEVEDLRRQLLDVDAIAEEA